MAGLQSQSHSRRIQQIFLGQGRSQNRILFQIRNLCRSRGKFSLLQEFVGTTWTFFLKPDSEPPEHFTRSQSRGWRTSTEPESPKTSQLLNPNCGMKLLQGTDLPANDCTDVSEDHKQSAGDSAEARCTPTASVWSRQQPVHVSRPTADHGHWTVTRDGGQGFGPTQYRTFGNCRVHASGMPELQIHPQT